MCHSPRGDPRRINIPRQFEFPLNVQKNGSANEKMTNEIIIGEKNVCDSRVTVFVTIDSEQRNEQKIESDKNEFDE